MEDKVKNKYRLEHVYEDDIGQNLKIVVEFSAVSLSDVVQNIQQFLRGCGFHVAELQDVGEE